VIRDEDEVQKMLAHAIECELATIEALEMRSRPPKRELERHRRIAEGLIFSYRGFHEAYDLMPHNCPRLCAALKD
jgi:hypothetical protein